MTTTPTNAHLRGLFYLFVFISVGIVFGRVSEMCADAEDDKCPDRLAAINAFAVVSFLVCIPLMLSTIINWLPDMIEVGLSAGLFMFTSVVVGVTTSVRTIREFALFGGFSIVSLPLAFGWIAEMFAAMACYFIICEIALKEKQVFAETKEAAAEETPAAEQPAATTENVETVAPNA